MITSLKIKNVASYDSAGVKIEKLKKVNYFFGFNGSGKSTIAKYLHALGKKDLNRYHNCSQEGYEETKEEILVFDEKFVERNFINEKKLNGIFALNETNKEIDEKIKANITQQRIIEQQKESVNTSIKTYNNELQSRKDALLTECFGKRKTFDSYSKITLACKGSKKSHYENVKSILESNHSIEKKDLTELSATYKKLYEQELKVITKKVDSALFSTIQKQDGQLNELLNEVIIGKDDVPIGKMINEAGLKSWVEQGKNHIRQTNKTCPFCQKETIDEDFISQLESYFDKSYLEKKAALERYKISFERDINNLINNIHAVSTEYNENNCLTDIEREIRDYSGKSENIFNKKISAPNEKYLLEKLSADLKDKLESINRKIDENNIFIKDKENAKKSLTNDIWNYIASECKTDIEKYENFEAEENKKIKEAEESIQILDSEFKELNKENAELQKQTVTTSDAVKAINEILKNSGFTGFSIEEQAIKENNISQYHLVRGNSSDTDVFKTLSEGEKNFIAFLYFYQLCIGTIEKDKSKVRKKIIVIDDPVSSMDSQVLFIISTLILGLTKWKNSIDSKDKFAIDNISQVFIFTHNLYFYKEVSFYKRPICKLKTHFKVIKNNEGNSDIVCDISKPLTDDYSLMWESVKQIKKQDDNDNKNNIFLANTFRRILESYASFIGLGSDAWATITENDNELSVEYILKSAFVSLINDDSHKTSPLDSHYFQKIHNETPKKLFGVFESIFDVIGKNHYEMMMKDND